MIPWGERPARLRRTLLTRRAPISDPAADLGASPPLWRRPVVRAIIRRPVAAPEEVSHDDTSVRFVGVPGAPRARGRSRRRRVAPRRGGHGRYHAARGDAVPGAAAPPVRRRAGTG